MTFFPDLSPYTYTPYDSQAGLTTLNVGWLDATEPYPTATTSFAFHERLLTFCSYEATVNHYFGYHFCPFCPDHNEIIRVEQGNERIQLGNGELRVIGGSVVYAAPTLIYHYVVAHLYHPPTAFIEAVLHGASPGSVEHQALLQQLAAVVETHRPPIPTQAELDERRAQEEALFGITPPPTSDHSSH